MSKLLAMMMKPKNYMYATIKGSLTENDGVFSGFSASNYLQLQHIIDFSKPFEILLKFTPTDFTTPLYLFSTRYSANSGLDIYIQNSKIRIWGSTNGTSLDISSYSIDTININTTYWYKLKYSPTQIIAELSTDGINFVQENNIALSNQIYQNNYNALIGHGQGINTNYFVGSIDLPNSYIKLGSTKYNLQAVVGYTVVGSPTIVDGVVSGFSSSDYLALQNNINLSTNFEIKIKFTPSSETTGGKKFLSLFYDNSIYLDFYTSGTTPRIDCQYSGGSYWAQIARNLSYDIPIIITIRGNGTTLNIEVNQNNNSQSSSKTLQELGIENITTNNIYLGRGHTTSLPMIDGSIDLNETYIKIDGKLWFNGQPA